MDGFKKRVNESVQLKLAFTLSVVIFAAGMIAGACSFLSALDEAHELQDDVLRQVAQLMDRERLSPVSAAADPRLSEGNEESRVIVQRLGEPNPSHKTVDDGGPLPLPASLPDGLQTRDAGGESFRVLVRTTAAGERIAVAQESSFRDEIARDSALRTLMPFLILMPVLLIVVAALVRAIFRPIAALSTQIDARAEQALHPIEASPLPVEVRPFALAINRLLARVAQSVDSERRFIADAAHELRSPMTALSLQAERLADADMGSVARERLAALRQGIARGRSLLDQLLALAKAQSAVEQPSAQVSVQRIYRRVLEDVMPLAEAKQIDIGVEGADDAAVQVSEFDMMAVVRNLVDNAIRYTPVRGRVDLSVARVDAHAVLRIRDTGPGIALDERERVCDPFYRTLGSEQMGAGLGLSIVKAIVDRIGATIRFDFADEASKTGLCVTVRIPVLAANEGALLR
jgi:two-component system OmpR family sensor kinase